jgi:CMP-N,N'-diacetyllegionaminic acid synthase
MIKLKVLAIIPARSGSKGLLHKNIRNLGKHPLFSYSIAAAAICKNIDRVIVTTDSPEYANIALKYGAEVPFLRPVSLARDTSTDDEFFAHAYDWLKINEYYCPDLVVHLRPTTPLREVGIIESAIAYMEKNGDATSLRSAYKTHLTPYKMFRNDKGYMVPFLKFDGIKEFYNLPRQHFEDTFIPNGYVDILRPEILMQTKLLHGSRMKLWETPEVPDIDTEHEISLAESQKDDIVYKKLLAYLDARTNNKA